MSDEEIERIEQHVDMLTANKRNKAEPVEVPLEWCENCHQQMLPKGSYRCIQCGHDPRQIKASA